MFLVFGTRASQAVINVVAFVCSYCGVHAQQRVVKRTTMLSLFFIPLIPLSRSYRNECANCGGVTRLTAQQAQHSLAWSSNQPQR